MEAQGWPLTVTLIVKVPNSGGFLETEKALQVASIALDWSVDIRDQ